jgi:hypothetical protein
MPVLWTSQPVWGVTIGGGLNEYWDAVYREPEIVLVHFQSNPNATGPHKYVEEVPNGTFNLGGQTDRSQHPCWTPLPVLGYWNYAQKFQSMFALDMGEQVFLLRFSNKQELGLITLLQSITVPPQVDPDDGWLPNPMFGGGDPQNQSFDLFWGLRRGSGLILLHMHNTSEGPYLEIVDSLGGKNAKDEQLLHPAAKA